MITIALIILSVISAYLASTAKSAGANMAMTLLSFAALAVAIWSVFL